MLKMHKVLADPSSGTWPIDKRVANCEHSEDYIDHISHLSKDISTEPNSQMHPKKKPSTEHQIRRPLTMLIDHAHRNWWKGKC